MSEQSFIDSMTMLADSDKFIKKEEEVKEKPKKSSTSKRKSQKQEEVVENKDQKVEEQCTIIDTEDIRQPFDVQVFGNELFDLSLEKNAQKLARERQHITAYSIAHDCIQEVIYRLRHTPVENPVDTWLPIFLRTQIGTAVHEFIQNNTTQFTETEINLKVPSLQFYGKVDFLCGTNILGEIKTCNYSDYSKIVKTATPRPHDYMQAMTYRYIISNYMDEIQKSEVYHSMGLKPKHSKYNIDKLQFLYIAHDIQAADCESISQSRRVAEDVKRLCGGKTNQFNFITSIVVDLTPEIINKADEFIKTKFSDIFFYMKSNTDPKIGARFIDSSACFFCLYHSICPHYRSK